VEPTPGDAHVVAEHRRSVAGGATSLQCNVNAIRSLRAHGKAARIIGSLARPEGQTTNEGDMFFDRTAGGHRFDFTRGVCFLCGITREEFKEHDYPRCAGEPYGKLEPPSPDEPPQAA
jgi:hypothetical protein